MVEGKTLLRLHSPFVFELARNVLRDKRHYYHFDTIEARRKMLLKRRDLIELTDHGAGSRTSASNKRTVRDITKSSAVNRKFGRLLFRLVCYFKPEFVVELGSSVGISTLYLATAHNGKTISIEGDPAIAAIARKSLGSIPEATENAQVITGTFDDVLPEVLREIPRVDLAYIDGNHQKEATLAYFEQLLTKVHNNSVLIFDDIYWSRDMAESWETIKASPKVRITVDLYRMGLVFFREEHLEKEDFTLYF